MTKAATVAKPVLEGPTTMENLKLLPEPKVLGPQHKPVPHWAVAEALEGQLKERGMSGFQTRYILSQEGQQAVVQDAIYTPLPTRMVTRSLERLR